MHGRLVTKMTKALVEDGPDRKKFRVVLDNYEGRNLLNIRYWYKDRGTGEFKPTRQGITITATNYLAFKSVISLHDEEVINHLNSGSQSAEQFSASQKANVEAAAAAQEVTKTELVVQPFRPASEMFKIEYNGGLARVIVNQRHYISEYLELENAPQHVIEMVSKIFVALDLSFFSAGQVKDASGAVVLGMFKQQLGLNITKYLR